MYSTVLNIDDDDNNNNNNNNFKKKFLEQQIRMISEDHATLRLE